MESWAILLKQNGHKLGLYSQHTCIQTASGHNRQAWNRIRWAHLVDLTPCPLATPRLSGPFFVKRFNPLSINTGGSSTCDAIPRNFHPNSEPILQLSNSCSQLWTLLVWLFQAESGLYKQTHSQSLCSTMLTVFTQNSDPCLWRHHLNSLAPASMLSMWRWGSVQHTHLSVAACPVCICTHHQSWRSLSQMHFSSLSSYILQSHDLILSQSWTGSGVCLW